MGDSLFNIVNVDRAFVIWLPLSIGNGFLDFHWVSSCKVQLYHFSPILQDPIVALLTLVMYLHPHFTPLHFGIIVQSVFNLAFVRGAISVATKLSPEERGAWQRVRRPIDFLFVRSFQLSSVPPVGL